MNLRFLFTLTRLDKDRVRVQIDIEEETLGILYFENPKPTWERKPILSTKWRCVDAKVEGLYVYGGVNITPKAWISVCQDLVLGYLRDEGDKLQKEEYYYKSYDDIIPHLKDEFKNLPPVFNEDDKKDDVSPELN